MLPEEPEAVLLGAAMLGAVASGVRPDLSSAMRAMSRPGRIIAPDTGAARRFHDAKYAVLQRMQGDQRAYRALMAVGTAGG